MTSLPQGTNLMHNSNLLLAGGAGESEMDIEFGYCSEEESIF